MFAGTRISIAQCTRGTHGGASSTTDTKVGIDLNLLTRLVGAHRLGRANIHTGVATHLLVAAVGAQLLFVDKELRFFKLAHQFTQAQQIGGGSATEIALRQRMTLKSALLAQVQHEVKLGRFFLGFALEVDGADSATGGHTISVCAALAQINLVIQTNRLFGTRGHTSIAACADIQINGVVAQPSKLKCT